MPRGDGTGPMGAGALTGRGMGPCAGTDRTGLGFGYGGRLGAACRRGFGGRLPGGFGGFGMGFAANPASSKTRKELLKDQKDFLQDRINAIDDELEDL